MRKTKSLTFNVEGIPIQEIVTLRDGIVKQIEEVLHPIDAWTINGLTDPERRLFANNN